MFATVVAAVATRCMVVGACTWVVAPEAADCADEAACAAPAVLVAAATEGAAAATATRPAPASSPYSSRCSLKSTRRAVPSAKKTVRVSSMPVMHQRPQYWPTDSNA